MKVMKKLCKHDDLLYSWRNWNIFYLFINALVTGPLLMSSFIICYMSITFKISSLRILHNEF